MCVLTAPQHVPDLAFVLFTPPKLQAARLLTVATAIYTSQATGWSSVASKAGFELLGPSG